MAAAAAKAAAAVQWLLLLCKGCCCCCCAMAAAAALLIGFNGSCLYLFCFVLQSRPTRRLQVRIGKAAGLMISGLTRAKLCTLFALLIGFNGSCLYLSFDLLSKISRPARRLHSRIDRTAGSMISGLPWAQLCTFFALLIGFNGSCLYLFCFALQSRPARRLQSRIDKAAGLLVSGLQRLLQRRILLQGLL
jgi:hypothetical protein